MNIDSFLGTERRQWQEAVLAEAARDRLIAQLPRPKDLAHALAVRLITALLRPGPHPRVGSPSAERGR